MRFKSFEEPDPQSVAFESRLLTAAEQDESSQLHLPANTWYRLIGADANEAQARTLFETPNISDIYYQDDPLPAFVYGTLRAGFGNHARLLKDRSLEEVEKIGTLWKTHTRCCLFAGVWPYMIESDFTTLQLPATQVVGELYRVGSKTATALDCLEQGYRREVCWVEDELGNQRQAIAYFGDSVTFDNVETLTFIPSGDLMTLYSPDVHWK